MKSLIAINEDVVAVQCSVCAHAYDAVTAEVCECVSFHRTLQCTHCGACSCALPLAARRAVLAALPPEIQRRMRQERVTGKRPHGVTIRDPLVVLADDDFDILSITRRHLERAGYGVLAVADGEQAWAAVSEYSPAIVVADALMPRLDGRELSRRIKADPARRGIPVVIMTSLYTGVAQRQEAFQVFGVDALLKKPIPPAVLLQTLCDLGVTPDAVAPIGEGEQSAGVVDKIFSSAKRASSHDG